MLIDNKANPRATNNVTRTPLHYACMNNHIEIVKLLIDNKANIEARDDDGDTPIDLIKNDNFIIKTEKK